MGVGTARVRAHTRASAKRAAAKSASSSNVTDLMPLLEARRTIAAQCHEGMPRVLHPLTTDSSCPNAPATSVVPPSSSMIEPQVKDDLAMAPTIVRTARTCQVVAICEATIRKNHGAINGMDSDEDIARRLIAVREHFRLNQVAFANEIHVAKNTLNGYEKGSRSLTLETAKRIRDRFGISLDWLLYGDVGQPGHELIVKFGPAPPIKADAEKVKKAGKRKAAQ